MTAVGVAALAIAGCGREDFENEPRPATPAEVGMKLDRDGVVVSPREFGAGLVNFTVANLGDTTSSVEITGPVDAASRDVPAGGTGTFKTELPSGEYEANLADSDAQPFEFVVGPDREASSGELLLP